MRVFRNKIRLPPRVQSHWDKFLESQRIPKRILLTGNSSNQTLTAIWIANRTGCPLYRVDLAAVVSKYIGETEKNLEKVFSKAENREWILFFDEADALFGKRTEVNDAHDRFVNVDTSWILQKIENYEGLVILASNKKGRISDEVLEQLKIEETLGTDDDEDEDDSD